jgi:dTDP-glucose 4,6-dehydratase
VGGLCEKKNIEVVHLLCDTVAKRLNVDPSQYFKQITYVKDRPGHDWRYAIDCEKISKTLQWQPSVNFEQGLAKTVDWYLENSEWVRTVRSGEYRQWIEKNYSDR